MRKLKVLLLATLLLLAVAPSGAHAFSNQCDSSLCLPNVDLPLDAPDPATSTTTTTGNIRYPAPGFYPAFTFTGSWSSIDPGRFGNAFTFNGSTDGLVFDAGASGDNLQHISPTPQVTLAMWVKATNPAARAGIVTRGVNNCGGAGAWGITTGTNGGLQFYSSIVNNQINYVTLRTPEIPAASIWDGNWHAVAGVFDEGTADSKHVLSLWVDGRQVAAKDIKDDDPLDAPLNYTQTDGRLFVAAGDGGQCGPLPRFAGSLDEVEVFHRALTAAQIKTLQDGGPTTPPDLPYVPRIQAPAIFGTPQTGQTLHCTNPDGLTNPSYTWERAPHSTTFEDDPNWFPIDNAAGDHYTVQMADEGSRVRCHLYGTAYDDTHGGYIAADRASTSLRADADVPANITPPTITGQPIADQFLTCHPGEWTNNPDPGDFTYQWVKNGAVIDSGPESTRQLTHTYSGSTFVANGDGGATLSCRVYAKNDVGYSTGADTDSVHAVDGVPFKFLPPTARFEGRPKGDINPIHQHAVCDVGSWNDDYARLQIPGYRYQYQWYRQFQSKFAPTKKPIPGADDSTYQLRNEDLGRQLVCKVTIPNVAGTASALTRALTVGFPVGVVDSTTFREGGNDGADPTSLLALPNAYVDAIDDIVVKRLGQGLTEAREGCRSGASVAPGAKIPDEAPDPSSISIHYPLGSVQRCQILLHAPASRISIFKVGGVRYIRSGCTVDPNLKKPSLPLCPSLRIEIPSVDPTHPPTSGDDLKALAPLQPKLIFWDLDGNGSTDAVCPGSAPVLRTIFRAGYLFHPKAVIIDGDSSAADVLHYAQADFNTSVNTNPPTGRLDTNQVRVCATSFDPPPDPDVGPCFTNADFGRVHLEGNLCPVSVRKLAAADYENLLGGPDFVQLRQFMQSASDLALANEPGVTLTKSARASPASVTWAGWGRSAASTPRTAADKAITSADENVQAALSAADSPTGYELPDLPKVDPIKGLVDAKSAYAFSQVLLTPDAVGIDGITQVPQHGTSALLIPGDVKNALPDTNSMILAGRDAASHLGPPSAVDGLPLSTGGVLKAALSDVPKSPNDILRETNLSDVQDQLRQEGTRRAKELLDKFDLGPFKLVGDVKIHAEDDGSASLEAQVKLPGLGAGPHGGDLVISALLHADLSGKIVLRGLHIQQPDAFLGALHLHGLDLAYGADTGLQVQGAILFPPNDDGLTVHNFQLDQRGHFQALDVDYKQTPGIMLGPGLFLTKLGGKLDLPRDTIGARATLSAGPSAGRCAVATLDGELDVYFGDPFSLDANTDVSLACIKLAHASFHGDATGLFSVDANVHFPPPDVDLGPVYFDAHLAAAIRLADQHSAWEVYALGNGGIHDLLSGQIQAALSNKGFSGCGAIEFEIPLIGKFLSLFSKHPKHVKIHLAGGAAVDFDHDLPPLNTVQFLENLHLYTGCDVGDYRTVTHISTPFAVNPHNFSFAIPKNAGASLLSLEGAGATPRVKLRSPSGRIYDFTTAVAKGHSVGSGAWGKVVNSEDRTVVILGDAQAGTWTAETADGTPAVIRVRIAPLLPKPAITGHVTGRGTKRTLTYKVAPITGQVVRLFEFARHGQKLIRTVSTGGHGKVRFTVSEASGTRRTIVAEITQNGKPRGNKVIAHYSARSPKVGRASYVHVKRRGRKAIITWGHAPLARAYQVTVAYGTGKRVPLFPRRGHRSVTVRKVRRGEGLRVTVTAISRGFRRGRAAHGSLAGNMRVGRVRHIPPHVKKKKKVTKKKKHKATKHKKHTTAKHKAVKPKRHVKA